MRFIQALFLLIVALGATHAQAQKKFTLQGQVTDSIDGKPIKKAVVNVAGTKFNDTTNNDGFYKITNLIAGTNNLVVIAEGYDTSVTKFYIKNNMTQHVKLLVRHDTMPKPQPADTVKKTPGSTTVNPAGTGKEPEKKKKGIDEKDKEFLGELIEDVIFYNQIFFSSFKEKKTTVKAKGFFTVENGVIYEFEALFNKMGEGFALVEFSFEKKGKH